MRRRLFTFLIAALSAVALTGLVSRADAQPIQGFYVGLGAGLVVPQDVHSTIVRPTSPRFSTGRLQLKENLGYDGTASIGYALGGGIRFEVEGDYLNNATKGNSFAPFSGHVRTTGVMANALYDFDIRSPYVFPYLGVGAGYMWTNLDNVVFVGPRGGFFGRFNDDSAKFAWQFIAGLAFPVPNAPGLSLTAQYRLLDVTGGERFTGRPTSVELGPQFTHTFTIGVRYAFYVPRPAPIAPTPAPIAAPAPAPARSYLVFFDWDKATLTDRARQIVREAADASTHIQYTQLRVNGYTDTSGSAAYNQALSIRRAEAVAAELVRDGVPRTAIAIQGFGETRLLVATANGVREPQNRRVEIIIG